MKDSITYSEKDMSLLSEALEKLLAWYLVFQRDLPWRKTKDSYCIWISEIMLQQTRVEAVKEYYARFLRELPNVKSLAEAPEEQVLKLWEGLGYYSRARNLKKAACMIQEEFEGVFPSEYEKIRKLPGIGDYTAGAISSIAFGLPYPAVDGNVLRVLSRLLNDFSDITEQKTKVKMTEMLRKVYPKENCSEVTQSLMELGAMVCVPNGPAKCGECPLCDICRAKKENTVEELPKKPEKTKRKIQKKTVVVLQCGENFSLRKRTEKGLLYQMWEFPNYEGHLTEQELKMMYPNLKSIQKIGSHRHIFTHIEWELVGYHITVEDEIQDFLWKTVDEICENYAIPGAFQAFWKKFL